jgi:hypothetical protein
MHCHCQVRICTACIKTNYVAALNVRHLNHQSEKKPWPRMLPSGDRLKRGLTDKSDDSE